MYDELIATIMGAIRTYLVREGAKAVAADITANGLNDQDFATITAAINESA